MRPAQAKIGGLDEVGERVAEARAAVVPAGDRALVVAALRCVDHVIVFEEDDVARLLLALRPDVHCKGTDYTADTVPERAVVEAYGGRTAIVGDPKSHASRDLVKRIQGAAQQE
jgi:bifunctional ADP-heptose synthase (sugar kinase/adenylyltransferase)